MVKPYRIKHKDSGYFYQRYNGSNLGKKGNVYMKDVLRRVIDESRISENVNMAEKTTFRTGGFADIFISYNSSFSNSLFGTL